MHTVLLCVPSFLYDDLLLEKHRLNLCISEKQGKLLAKAQKHFIKAHPLSTEKRVYLELFEDMAFDFDRESPFHVCYNTKLDIFSHSAFIMYICLKTEQSFAAWDTDKINDTQNEETQ